METKDASISTSMNHRDDDWLNNQLELIWQNHFDDVQRDNQVLIRWGRVTRTRLGSITARGGHIHNPEKSLITINSLLKDRAVPEVVVWQTIAHEVSHYAHGFCSPLPRKYKHPHKGRIIELELCNRQLAEVYFQAQAWLKNNWSTHLSQTSNLKIKPKKRRTYGRTKQRMSLLSHIQKIITG